MIDINKLKIGDRVVYMDNSHFDLTQDKEYEVLGVDNTDGTIKVLDNGEDAWWYECAYFKLHEKDSDIKSHIVVEKNFIITLAGGIFKVEAIGLSEEKINKIIDILAK